MPCNIIFFPHTVPGLQYNNSPQTFSPFYYTDPSNSALFEMDSHNSVRCLPQYCTTCFGGNLRSIFVSSELRFENWQCKICQITERIAEFQETKRILSCNCFHCVLLACAPSTVLRYLIRGSKMLKNIPYWQCEFSRT